jgi:hypothetical protein
MFDYELIDIVLLLCFALTGTMTVLAAIGFIKLFFEPFAD